MPFKPVMVQLIGDGVHTNGAEDFYSNLVSDMGRETICGISRAKNPDAAVWPEVDRLKTAATPVDQWRQDGPLMAAVMAFYQALWAKFALDYLPDLLQGPVFGGIVNQGDQVVIDLQECLQLLGQAVVADGQMGPATLHAVNQVLPQVLSAFLWKRRAEGYLAIVDAHPDQRDNLHGWFNRLRLGL